MYKIARTTKAEDAQSLKGLWRPSFTLVPEKQLIYVFGGGGIDNTHIHVFDLTTNEWSTPRTAGNAPAQRFGHTACYWKGKIIIFGGMNEAQFYFGDLRIFDIASNEWSQPSVLGPEPCARYLHSAVIYKDSMVLYGGFTTEGTSKYAINEAQSIDLITMTWSVVSEVPARYNHSAIVLDNKMFMFGGKGDIKKSISTISSYGLENHRFQDHDTFNDDFVHLTSAHHASIIGRQVFIFGKYKVSTSDKTDINNEAWTINLDTMVATCPEIGLLTEGKWSYATVINKANGPSIMFLGNAEKTRQHPYDHFQDIATVDPQSLNIWVIPSSELVEDFRQMLDLNQFSDFTIVAQDSQEIPVHKAVLFARFPYFRRLYESQMVEVTSSRMEIAEPYEVVHALIVYLYTDKLPNNATFEIMANLIVIADIYDLNRLKIICSDKTSKVMNEQNAALLYERALRANADGLCHLVTEYILNNFGLCSPYLKDLPYPVLQELLAAMPPHAKVIDTKAEIDVNSLKQDDDLEAVDP